MPFHRTSEESQRIGCHEPATGRLVFAVHKTWIRAPGQVGDLLDAPTKNTEKFANPVVKITVLFLCFTVGPVRIAKKEIGRSSDGRRIPLIHAASLQPLQ